jgi:hypothetical protein
MTPEDIASTIDATPTVVSLMRHQALGLFWEGLLRSEARERFASLIETTSEKTSIPARAGGLLLEQANNKQFVDQLAIDLVESLGSVFWVEMSEYLIAGTTCRFNAFGAFKRFAHKVSFIPEWLWEAAALPCVLPESAADSAIDALCRFAMEGGRHDAQTRYSALLPKGAGQYKKGGAKPLTGYRPDLPGAFPPLATELLRERLPGILTVLRPTAPSVAGLFASAASLASYYAWVIAFDAVLRQGFVSVPGVGSFELLPTMAQSQIKFSAEQNFWKLIKINAETKALPDEIEPTVAAA